MSGQATTVRVETVAVVDVDQRALASIIEPFLPDQDGKQIWLADDIAKAIAECSGKWLHAA